MKIKKAVIPAAGFGTRLIPATKTVPKEMLPIVDTPTIHYIVEEAVAAGIEDILIITNRQKSAMEDYFDYYPELESRLSRDGKTDELKKIKHPAEMANFHFIRQLETKGLGHAISRARHFVGNEPFAVLLGDDIMVSKTPVIGQLIAAYNETGASCVGVKEVSPEAVLKYCTLKVNHIKDGLYDVLSLIEKPRPDQIYSCFSILGRYVLTPAIFDILDSTPPGHGGEIQLTDGINTLCRKERVTALDFEGRRYDAGNLCGYLEVIMDMALKHPESAAFMRDYIINKSRELV